MSVDAWVLEHRGPKRVLDPARAYASAWEEEADGRGGVAPTAVVFITNRECPFRCVMCDLWVNTLDQEVAPGLVPLQIRDALDRLPPARWVKLYNAGSAFDPRAIPPGDDAAIAQAVTGFERVIVESHPAFLAGAHASRCLAFRDALDGALEVAVGLETAHPDVLARLNKRMTLASFRRAAEFLVTEDIALRVFILLNPPFLPAAQGLEWACRSLDVAAAAGARVCSVIPTRSGNGALEALETPFVPPRLQALEAAVEYGLSLGGPVVLADLWEAERFARCPCDAARLSRLAFMNRHQRVPAPAGGACEHDVYFVIVGSGMGGSIMAMVARRLGRRVFLIERGRHPRFAIGESSSPLAGILIEQLAARYDLPRLAPLAAYGTWQRLYPQLGCGLKRGFTFFRHDAGRRYRTAPDRSNQLLVAGSPCDELADTHWLRSDVDAWLMREAVSLGAEYLDKCQVERVDCADGGVRVHGSRGGRAITVDAAGIIDATGPRGCLHRALGLAESDFDGYPATRTLFSHFEHVPRCTAVADFDLATPGHGAQPPYPIDDAAVHHVFDGGWMWVLRFGNGVTSAGVAVEDWLAAELRLADGAAAWPRLLARFPSLEAAFAGATAVRGFDWQPRLTYRTAEVAGPRWALLPSAAAFVDPLFSTGFPLTLLGIERLGRLLERGLFTAAGGADARQGLAAYASTTLAEADQAARFVAGCYASFPRFDAFAAYSMFYFAAASFAEASRRLAPDGAGIGFLGAKQPDFAAALARLSPAAGTPGPCLARDVREAIEPMNVAGLCRPENANWYGVDNADLLHGAPKLGVPESDVRAMLERLGLERA